MADKQDVKSFMELRKELGLTQRDIAVALGVTEDTVANWENGRSIPKLTIPQVKELCRLLGLPIERIPNEFSASKGGT
jgi:DNA-binding XRE family transcriptional regulator